MKKKSREKKKKRLMKDAVYDLMKETLLSILKRKCDDGKGDVPEGEEDFKRICTYNRMEARMALEYVEKLEKGGG